MGEGLQHDDGHSHVLASVIPNIRAYDPAYAYEMVAIVREGIARMYARASRWVKRRPAPPRPGESRGESLVKRRRASSHVCLLLHHSLQRELRHAESRRPDGRNRSSAASTGSSPRRNSKARVTGEVARSGRGRLRPAASGGADTMPSGWSEAARSCSKVVAPASSWPTAASRPRSTGATSFQQLRADGLAVDRWNRAAPRRPGAGRSHQRGPDSGHGGPVVVATDWIRAYPDLVAPWLPANRLILGTDGFGSVGRAEPLRRLFEITPPHIAAARSSAARAAESPARKPRPRCANWAWTRTRPIRGRSSDRRSIRRASSVGASTPPRSPGARFPTTTAPVTFTSVDSLPGHANRRSPRERRVAVEPEGRAEDDAATTGIRRSRGGYPTLGMSPRPHGGTWLNTIIGSGRAQPPHGQLERLIHAPNSLRLAPASSARPGSARPAQARPRGVPPSSAPRSGQWPTHSAQRSSASWLPKT